VDPDESVLGLMAVHLLRGEAFPIFFYGQRYGLSTIEVFASAAGFIPWGVSAVSLKAAMLLLWILGWAFFFLSVQAFGGARAAWIGGGLLILCPAWAAWSLKARGGYLTAFCLFNLGLWLVARRRDELRRPWPFWLSMGTLGGFLFLSHRLWLMTFLPFALLRWRRGQWPMALAGGAVGAAWAFAVGRLGRREGSDFWSPHWLDQSDVAEGLLRLPFRLWELWTGAFYLWHAADVSLAGALAGLVWAVAFLGVLAVSLVRLGGRPPFGPPAAAVLAMAIPAALSLLSSPTLFMVRYLLPAAVPFVLAVSLASGKALKAGRPRAIACGWGLVLLGLAGAAGLAEVARHGLTDVTLPPGASDGQALERLTRELQARRLAHVYSLDAFLQWKLMFASEGRIEARWVDPGDRYPPIPRSVDRARAAEEPVALIGRLEDVARLRAAQRGLGDPLGELIPVEGLYFILPSPSVDLLRALGFILNNEGSRSVLDEGSPSALDVPITRADSPPAFKERGS